MTVPDETLSALASAATTDELTAICRQEADVLGFDHFVFALRVPTRFSDARLIILDGYPPEWVAHYFARSHYASDPVMAYCTRHVVPIEWRDLPLVPGSPAAVVMQEAAGFGLRAGVTMPVHTPNGELGILSMALDRDPAEAHAMIQRAMPRIQVFGGYLHEAVRRVARLGDEDPPVSLSPRERECLRWAADGKTSGEIAQLMGMAESTVNFHLKNAMQKLDVSNRPHAVARATLKGLIQPKPF